MHGNYAHGHEPSFDVDVTGGASTRALIAGSYEPIHLFAGRVMPRLLLIISY
jgi:hypothetical protein